VRAAGLVASSGSRNVSRQSSTSHRRGGAQGVRRDRAIIIRDCDGRAFGLSQARIERVPFADGRAFQVPQAGIGAESPPMSRSLCSGQQRPAQNWDAYLPRWTIQCPPPNDRDRTCRRVLISASHLVSTACPRFSPLSPQLRWGVFAPVHPAQLDAAVRTICQNNCADPSARANWRRGKLGLLPCNWRRCASPSPIGRLAFFHSQCTDRKMIRLQRIRLAQSTHRPVSCQGLRAMRA
jgi:hypothetical protein